MCPSFGCCDCRGCGLTIVRDAVRDDIDRVVSLHRAAFDDFFLTSLGPRFLRHLYSGYLAHASGILLVACDPIGGPSTIAGFVAGTTEPDGFYRWMRRSRGPVMAVAAVPALVRRPRRVGRRLASALHYRGDASPTVACAALLASLAVDPPSGGQGIGGLLVEAFLARSKERDRDQVYLTTDVLGNDGVLEFYRRRGFRETKRFIRADGRQMALLMSARPDVPRQPGNLPAPGAVERS